MQGKSFIDRAKSFFRGNSSMGAQVTHAAYHANKEAEEASLRDGADEGGPDFEAMAEHSRRFEKTRGTPFSRVKQETVLGPFHEVVVYGQDGEDIRTRSFTVHRYLHPTKGWRHKKTYV